MNNSILRNINKCFELENNFTYKCFYLENCKFHVVLKQDMLVLATLRYQKKLQVDKYSNKYDFRNIFDPEYIGLYGPVECDLNG